MIMIIIIFRIFWPREKIRENKKSTDDSTPEVYCSGTANMSTNGGAEGERAQALVLVLPANKNNKNNMTIKNVFAYVARG
jgi:hypothetical protein